MFNTLLQNITEQLEAKKIKVSTAESCTGGLLSAQLTRLPGSSAWFNMGYITYSNEAKVQMLNVSEQTLASFGAVSEEVVREMALGALVQSKCDFAISISGIAGPTGGTEAKPVGTVWFGLASKQRIWATHKCFSGTRESIRSQAVVFALKFLEEYM